MRKLCVTRRKGVWDGHVIAAIWADRNGYLCVQTDNHCRLEYSVILTDKVPYPNLNDGNHAIIICFVYLVFRRWYERRETDSLRRAVSERDTGLRDRPSLGLESSWARSGAES